MPTQTNVNQYIKNIKDDFTDIKSDFLKAVPIDSGDDYGLQVTQEAIDSNVMLKAICRNGQVSTIYGQIKIMGPDVSSS